ncbi:N,N-dimethylformamidase beta subunit family domain-containing protein [Terrabacter carboxydivorans]|uniref:N,N-dimethylformamidase beta subunit family domain-containing protein n=1 Tax=Terrabacter carboxydivorans TaxID=619730 RepID=UPI0031D4D8D7
MGETSGPQGPHGPSRRTVLAGAGALALGACTSGSPSPSATAGVGTASPSPSGDATTTAGTTPSRTGTISGGPGWVRAENARPGTTAWRIDQAHLASETELAGYTDTVSVLPGDSFGLHLSSALGPVTVRAYRLGHYAGAGAREVWASDPVAATKRPSPTTDALHTVRCSWPESLRVPTTGWPEGSYLLRLQAGGRARYVPMVVRSRATAGRLVLVSAVATHQAYNQWGGHSLYKGPDQSFATRAAAVSFERPYDRNGAPLVLAYEQGVVLVAESLDLDLAYVTSWDLHHEPDLLAGARGVVSPGHDEYWTLPMRRHVEAARDAGVNLGFLGANAVYWRARFSGDGRLLTCYKSATADPQQGSAETTAQWRQSPHPDPENSLTGMLYEAFPAEADLVVHDADFFLLAGTGAARGDTYAGLVATEIDRAYPVAGTPTNLQVVAHSPVPQAGKPDTHSDLTYYSAPGGAGVLSVGTLAWTAGLRGAHARPRIDGRAATFARTVTTNLFRAMADGPMGRAHPARGNLAAIGASPSTRTGTGGPVASA